MSLSNKDCQTIVLFLLPLLRHLIEHEESGQVREETVYLVKWKDNVRTTYPKEAGKIL